MKHYELLGSVSIGGLLGLAALTLADGIIAWFVAGVVYQTGVIVLSLAEAAIVHGVEPLVASLPVAQTVGTGSMHYSGDETLIHDAGVGEVSEGNVVVFDHPGDETPTVHRTHFYVEEGENWYSRADEEWIGDADNCDELRNCPAPHDGWITAGDAMDRYDQARGYAAPIKPEWVEGRVLVG